MIHKWYVEITYSSELHKLAALKSPELSSFTSNKIPKLVKWSVLPQSNISSTPFRVLFPSCNHNMRTTGDNQDDQRKESCGRLQNLINFCPTNANNLCMNQQVRYILLPSAENHHPQSSSHHPHRSVRESRLHCPIREKVSSN